MSYSRTVLPNGLVVLLNEDHSAPVVAVDVWYHIGAKNEKPGHTGLAHLCEHLMGQGSPNEPLPPKVFIGRFGGVSSNWAATTEDVTHYFTTIPSNELETVLWLESDRMAAPLTRAEPGRMDAVREVIRQERAFSREAPLFALSRSFVVQHLLDEPYHLDPLGPMDDLNVATADDAKAFCLPYYVPNNAVLSLSGDFNSATVLAWAKKYFGPIARKPLPPQPVVQMPAETQLNRLVFEDKRARSAWLQRAWVGAATANPDRNALAALGFVLSHDRVGRLSKALIYDRPLATTVMADNSDLEKSGVFQILVIARPNVALTTIEQVVDSVVADVRDHGITAEELEPFKRANAVQAITTLQSHAARADTLANGEIFAHDPVDYAKQVNRAFSLTPADIQRAARTYLKPGGVLMNLIPAGKTDLIAHPELPYTNVTPAPGKPVVTP